MPRFEHPLLFLFREAREEFQSDGAEDAEREVWRRYYVGQALAGLLAARAQSHSSREVNLRPIVDAAEIANDTMCVLGLDETSAEPT